MKNLNYKLTKRGSRFFIKNIEEKTILLIFTKIKIEETLTIGDKLVLEAFQRYSPALEDPNVLREYLSNLSDAQLNGVASNVKGILHELEFVTKENSDYDSVRAVLYENTNHPGYDIKMYDISTGESWDVQLKATDSASYVEDWMDKNDGDIRVTEELANKEGYTSSDFSNEELIKRVEEFIDTSITKGSSFNASIFDYFPHVTSLVIGVMIWQLYQRKRRGEISDDEFKKLIIKNTGQKAIKVTTLMALLSIPGINVGVTGYLIYNFAKDLNKSGLINKFKNYTQEMYKKSFNSSFFNK
ncbi:hypothetical protein OAI96_00350 [Pelagibacteraceae bacterium]|nr:hypothetical protein [Pelagibacteraceae bacterium]